LAVDDVPLDPADKSKLKLRKDANSSQDPANGVESFRPAIGPIAVPDSEKNVHSMTRNSAPSLEKESHSLLPSLLVVGLLFLLLGATGFGPWKIIVAPEASGAPAENQGVAASEGSQTGETAKDTGPKNPIERAKQTIAKVPQLDMEDLTGETRPTADEAPKVEATEAANQVLVTTDRDTVTNEVRLAVTRTEPTAAIEATKAIVSEVLGSLHIGGMRQGARPMVSIEGRAHNVGDTVQTETGLRFDGIRHGKLAFFDQNEIVSRTSF